MGKTDQVVSVDVECGPCKSTGIFRGFEEPKGTGVICLACKGTGKATLTYKPFTGRKQRNDIQTVRRSAGSFMATGMGPEGGSVSYQEFLAGKMP